MKHKWNYSKLMDYAYLIKNIYTTIGSSFLLCLLIWIYMSSKDTMTKIAIVPFIICILAVLIMAITHIIHYFYQKKKNNIDNDDALEKIDGKMIILKKIKSKSNHLFLIGFFTFWFGFLIIADYLALQSWSDGGYQIIIFSILFWIVGIKVFINKWKQTKS